MAMSRSGGGGMCKSVSRWGFDNGWVRDDEEVLELCCSGGRRGQAKL